MKHQRISHKDFFTSISLALLSTICLALAAGFWKYLTTLGSLQEILFSRFTSRPDASQAVGLLPEDLKREVQGVKRSTYSVFASEDSGRDSNPHGIATTKGF